MHTNRFYRRRRMSARSGGFAIAMGVCLCAGQVLDTSAAVAVPAVPTGAAPAVSPEMAPVGPVDTTTAAPVPGAYTVTTAVGGWEPTSIAAAGVGTDPVATAGVGTDPVAAAGVGTDPVAAAHPVAGGRRARPTARERVLAEARRLRGRPYVYGAAGPRAFDCSGFTRYVFRKAGKHLPHDANAQQRRGRPVSRRKARAGDLMVFRNGSYGYHAAIYAGAGYMYDAPHPGAQVGKHKIWSRNYVVRRLV